MRKLTLILFALVLLVGGCFVLLWPALQPWPPFARSLALSGDGRVLAVGTFTWGQVLVCSIDPSLPRVLRHEVNEYGGSGEIMALALSYNGDRIAFSARHAEESQTGEVTQCRELNGIRLGKVLYQDPTRYSRMHFCGPDGESLALWERTSAEAGSLPTKVIRLQQTEDPCVPVFTKQLALVDCCSEEVLRTLTAPGSFARYRRPGLGSVSAVAFDAEANRAAAGFDTGEVIVWKAPTWEAEKAIDGFSEVVGIAFVRTGHKLIIADSGSLNLVDYDSACILWRESIGLCDLFAADSSGRLLVSAQTYDSQVIVWKVQSDRCIPIRSIFLHEIPELRSRKNYPWRRR